MDAGFLNFHKEEDFTSYFLDSCEDSQSYDGTSINSSSYQWDWSSEEQELKGDFATIPAGSLPEDLFPLSTSPPSKEDYNKILTEWNQLVNTDIADFPIPDIQAPLEVNASPPEDLFFPKENTFDIAKYLEDDVEVPPLVPRHGGKRIDLKKQRYVIEEEDEEDDEENEDTAIDVSEIIEEDEEVVEKNTQVIKDDEKTLKKEAIHRGNVKKIQEEDEDITVDVETVTEDTISHPVLQAGDLNSLLMQFEATEETNLKIGTSFDKETDLNVANEEDEKVLTKPCAKNLDSATNCTNLNVKNPNIARKRSNLVQKSSNAAGKMKRISAGAVAPIEKVVHSAKIPADGVKSTNNGRNIKKIENKAKHKSKHFQKGYQSGKAVKEALTIHDDPFRITLDDIKSITPTQVPQQQQQEYNAKDAENESSNNKNQCKSNNKKILDSLPPELIDRIRQSSKRKGVTLIPAICPAKRRPSAHVHKEFERARINIYLDHDYCCNYIGYNETSGHNGLNNLSNGGSQIGSTNQTPPSYKDSGFSSCEEDEQRVIRSQPTVKSADGKLMVSLLKTNTIKKKLNLEEYKKRLQSRGQQTSGCNSPRSVEEDENSRRLKHQEKLMKMAQDIVAQQLIARKSGQDEGVQNGVEDLKVTGNKVKIPQNKDKELQSGDKEVKVKSVDSLKPLLPSTSVKIEENVKVEAGTCDLEENYQEHDERSIKIEKDIESNTKDLKTLKVIPKMNEIAIKKERNVVMKTLISVSTNTEESWGHLEQILQNARLKINQNSLLTSIVEHLPKVKPVIGQDQLVVHEEDKRIVYIDEEHKPETRNTSVQTTHSSSTLLRRRRRVSSTSSNSSTSSRTSSSSSDKGSTFARSRTPSPIRRRHQRYLQDVEERRVVYVGGISDDMTREELRRRFIHFGHITNVSVHFRRHAVNYGFVTFQRKEDAYEAMERGNEDPDNCFDLSFGGRRVFCQTSYADLDNLQDEEYWSGNNASALSAEDENSFDTLLRKAQAKLRKRKNC